MVQRKNRTVYRSNDWAWYAFGGRLMRVLHPRQIFHHTNLETQPEPTPAMVERCIGLG